MREGQAKPDPLILMKFPGNVTLRSERGERTNERTNERTPKGTKRDGRTTDALLGEFRVASHSTFNTRDWVDIET